MSEDTPLPFDLPSVARKKVSVAFDGGMLSSNGGVLLLRGVERRLGLAARLAGCIRDGRKPESILHSDLLGQRPNARGMCHIKSSFGGSGGRS
jgi:hypothetical protein